ncbi:MAG TPA: MmcQ/YjbR family DNA-binding protein [Acidimicrobiia bacterium]
MEERPSHGEPSWFVAGKRMFVTYAEHHHDDRVAIWGAAPEGMQPTLVESDPEHYFVPPYVGGRGWVGYYLDGAVDWDEVNELVLDAFLTVAPARLAALVKSD